MPPRSPKRSNEADHIDFTRIPMSDKIIIGANTSEKSKIVVLDSPFGDNQKNRFKDDQEIVERCINSILSGDPISAASSMLHDISRIISTSEDCLEMYNFISPIIIDFAIHTVSELSTLTDIYQIGDYWTHVDTKINLLNTAFSPLCRSTNENILIKNIFNNKILEELSDKSSLFGTICNIIIEAFNNDRSEDIQQPLSLAFKFVKECGHFTQDFLPEFVDSIIRRMESSVENAFEGDLKNYFTTVIDFASSEINAASSLIPPSSVRVLQNAINQLIFTSKFKDITNIGLPILVKNKDAESIKICVNLAKDTDNITMFVKKLSLIFEQEAAEAFKTKEPIEEILSLYKTLMLFHEVAKFSQDDMRVLRIAFEKGFNNSPDVAARLLAIEINKIFIHNRNITSELLDLLLAIFKMLNCKDVFVTYHQYLLAKRVLLYKAHTIAADQEFMKDLLELCGPDYAKTLKSIFDDLAESQGVMAKLRAEGPLSPWFSCMHFARETWPGLTVGPAGLPRDVAPLMARYEAVVRSEKKKLFQALPLTRVKLSVEGVAGVRTIRCSGSYASVLLLFNEHRSLLTQQIADMTKIELSEVEAIVESLRKRRAGSLLVVVHHMVRVNPEAAVDGGALDLAFTFPQLSHQDDDKTKNAIMQNRDSQVDALVVQLLKEHKSLDKDDLKMQMKDLLKFRMEDELFEKRLANLQNRSFIKLDAGRVNYLP